MPTTFQTVRSKAIRVWNYVLSKDALLALVVVVVTIVVGVSIGWENNKVVPVNQTPSAHDIQATHESLGFLSNWDGPDYLTIAQQGYTKVSQTSFFPLYPLTVRVVNTIINNPLYSGLLVSWASLVGAVYFYIKVIKKFYGIKSANEALRATLLFVLFPAGIFLIATYTESLFAFLSLGAVYFTLKKRYLLAGLFALLGTATHINGLFILVLIAWLAWEQKAKLPDIVKMLFIGCLGLIAYMAFLYIKFHNPIGFVSGQKGHGWLKYSYIDFAMEIASLNGLFLLLIAISAVYWWFRRKSFFVYSLLYVCIALLGGLGGFARYGLMVFPFQFMLYEQFRKYKTAYTVVIALFAIVWAFFALQYAGGYSGGS